MIGKERLRKLSTQLVVDKDDFMRGFRQNLEMYVHQPDLTLRELSELSGVPYATLNNILYVGSSDIKLSTVMALAKVLNVSVDELVGIETMDPDIMECVRLARGLPDDSIYLVKYFIRHQYKIRAEAGRTRKYISIIMPSIVNGILATTNAVDLLCVDSLPADIVSKACLAIKIPCDLYMPYYLPGETILVAADRDAENGERLVVTSKGGIYIVKKKRMVLNGVKEWRYIPLMSTVPIYKDSIDDVLGYVIGFINSDGEMGIR